MTDKITDDDGNDGINFSVDTFKASAKLLDKKIGTLYPRDEVHDFMKNKHVDMPRTDVKNAEYYRDNPDAFMKDIVAEAVPLKDEAPEPPWEDAILTISVSKSTDEYRYCDVTIEEWHNKDLVHPSDLESIENTLEDYELKTGKWKVQINVTWSENPATPDCPADWDDDLDVTELEKL